MAQSTNRLVRRAKIIFVFVVAALAGGITGVMFAYAPGPAGGLDARRLRAEHHHAGLCVQRRRD